MTLREYIKACVADMAEKGLVSADFVVYVKVSGNFILIDDSATCYNSIKFSIEL